MYLKLVKNTLIIFKRPEIVGWGTVPFKARTELINAYKRKRIKIVNEIYALKYE